MDEFIGERIEVKRGGRGGPPRSFVWRGAEHRIVAVTGPVRRLDFRRDWWRRRHRDYYTVTTESGETFEIYLHRGPGRRYWVLYRRLEG